MNRTALGVLIDRVKDEQGISDEYIAQRARLHGHQISKQHISSLRAAAPVKSLVPSTLRALADGLGVPLARVVEAALPSAGLPVPGTPGDWSAEAAVRADPELPEAAKRILLTMLASARSDSAPQPAPSNVKALKRPPHVKGASREASQGNDLAARTDMET